MSILNEGANIGEIDWDDWVEKYLDKLAATETDSSIGASVQKSGDSSKSSAMQDQAIGKIGPMIGKWDSESASRMVQEF